MGRSWWTWLLGVAWLLGGSASKPAEAPAEPQPPAEMSVADIRACMRANVADRGFLREVELRSTDPAGATRTLRMEFFWKAEAGGKETRTLLRVVEPEDSAGAALLAVSRPTGDEVYLYLPALGHARRLAADESRSLFGTDFSYADVKQLQALAESAEVKRLPDEVVFDRAAFVLDASGAPSATGYTRIRSWVDRSTCNLLRSEFFTSGSEPQKVLEADLSTQIFIDPWWLILGYTMENRNTGSRTELRLSNVYLDEEPPESLFDPARFPGATP